MNRIAIAFAAAVIVAASTPVNAQEWPQRRPGLWEAQLTTSGSGVPNMQEKLAAMPPEKRAQMEALMKQRGMSVGADSATRTIRYCLTPEEAAQEAHKKLAERFQRNVESHCDEKVFSRTSTEVRFHAVCEGRDGRSEIDGRIFDLSPQTVAMDMSGKSATKGEFRMQQRAHWLASDCGNAR